MDSNGYNPSLFSTDKCFLCGSQGDLVRHEVFHGPNRLKSKRYGCWITLCPMCHMSIHARPLTYKWVQGMVQDRAMEVYGWKEDDFREVFGKSWL